MSKTRKSLRKQQRKQAVTRKIRITELAVTDLLSELVDKLPESKDRMFGHQLLLRLIETI